jgi:DNA-binding response OmpR family regulator
MNSATILMVEDNKSILEINGEALKMEGYMVVTAETLEKARAALEAVSPDIIILDIMMPDGSGLDFCEEIRNKTTAPIIFLTCMNETEDMVRGLEKGGDDYITKPYHIEVLIARIEANLRRVHMDWENQPSVVRLGPLTLDMTAASAYLDGENLLLKPKEFQLLAFFIRNAGKEFTSGQLYKTIWGMDANGDTRTVKAHISRLRRKLKMNEDGIFSIEMINRKHYIWKGPE